MDEQDLIPEMEGVMSVPTSQKQPVVAPKYTATENLVNPESFLKKKKRNNPERFTLTISEFEDISTRLEDSKKQID